MIKNINAAKELIKCYREITLDSLQDTKETMMENDKCVDDIADILWGITGYGLKETCTLCIEANGDCTACIYSTVVEHKEHLFPCCNGKNADTYMQIAEADTFEELLIAVGKRANHIEKILKRLK